MNNYPYLGEQFSNISNTVFIPANLSYDGEVEGEDRFQLLLDNQFIFYHLKDDVFRESIVDISRIFFNKGRVMLNIKDIGQLFITGISGLVLTSEEANFIEEKQYWWSYLILSITTLTLLSSQSLLIIYKSYVMTFRYLSQ